MIISISGVPGAGKSSIGKALAKRLKYRHYSVGDLRGKMALERGMNIDELNKLGEQEFFTDKEADEYQTKLGKTKDNFVIDGRLSFHFIPQSIKIFLDVDTKLGAERIMADHRVDEPQYPGVAEAQARLQQRVDCDKRRYQKYYKLNPFDRSQYDYVLDTTHETVESAADKLIAFIER